MPRRHHRSLARRGHHEIETASEAEERYYREESQSRGGLFTPGGATAGGIFGDGPVVVQDHDAPAAHRTIAAMGAARGASTEDALRRELKQSRKLNERLLKLLEEKEHKQLSGRSRGRRRDEEEDLDDEDLDDDDFDDDD